MCKETANKRTQQTHENASPKERFLRRTQRRKNEWKTLRKPYPTSSAS